MTLLHTFSCGFWTSVVFGFAPRAYLCKSEFKMKISIIAFVAILLQLAVVVNGQFQILFTKDYIKVHSKRTVDYSLHLRLAHDHAKHLEDDFTHDHGLRDAAKSCATLIRYHADFHDLLFNQTLYRDERGITALWEIWSAVSGAPDPQDWDNQKTLMKDFCYENIIIQYFKGKL